MKKQLSLLNVLLFSVCALVLATAAGAQSLTVRQIMAEPSIAGQRVSGEKLSPDGEKVVYLWNAEGKPRLDLYIVSTSGGLPEKILSPAELPVPYRTPDKENKLDYGIEVRDEFLKARENQLGNFEWSPDSTRLIFNYGGDLYLLSLDNIPSNLTDEIARERRNRVESLIKVRADLVPELVHSASDAGLREQDLFGQIADARSALLNSIFEQSDRQLPTMRTLAAKDALDELIDRLMGLTEAYPALRSSVSFRNLLDKLVANQNRLNVAITDLDLLAPKLKTQRLTITQAPEFGARFLDNDRIIYSQSGHIFLMHLNQPLVVQLTRESNPQAFKSVGAVTPSKDGSKIAYVVSDSSKQKTLVVPNYLPELTAAGNIRRGWTEQTLFATLTDGSRDTPFEIRLPKAEGVSSFRRMVWAADNRSLIVDRIDKDTKRRQLFYVYNVGAKDEKAILVTEETDEKWQASLSSIFEPHPTDPNKLFFGSERDGYNHLYLATLEAETPPVASVPEANAKVAKGTLGLTSKVDIEQLTKGPWQVEWAKWLQDGGRIAYLSTTGNPAERRLYTVFSADGTYDQLLPSTGGMIASPQLDDRNSEPVLLSSRSQWNQPDDLWAQKICTGCGKAKSPLRLTTTVPLNFQKYRWTAPQFIEIASRDGKKIPAKIYLPPGHNPRSRTKYPMVIFVHGAGYLQNVINGWNNYYREFMFNDLLAKRGYVVLDIDYRGSAGYGRDWRTDVHDFLGGKDFDDHIDSIDHMVANYAVDQKRIGAYGGSYGGFLAGMLAMRAPERIAAAAALRPVFDWKNYFAANPFYTAQRLGFPDKNPEAYRRSSPISYADKLERPLLILHGMADSNVHVQDSVQLMEKLIRLGKTQYFEAMLYPSEDHGFVRPESWADEYERILAFFEKHLNDGKLLR